MPRACGVSKAPRRPSPAHTYTLRRETHFANTRVSFEHSLGHVGGRADIASRPVANPSEALRPDDDRGTGLRKSSQELLDQSVDRMAALQERMYAQDRWAVLLIFQALDAAGKDGTIKHVMSGLNPQSCEVHPFKSPSPEEIDHDFMWRTSKLLPRRGHIGIFNRSYYEEVLIVRVHPEYSPPRECRRSSSASESGTSAIATSPTSRAICRGRA